MITKQQLDSWYESGQASRVKTGLSLKYLLEHLFKGVFNKD